MESMTVQSQNKTTTSRAAEAALDLRSYMGERAHAGQAFSIDGAFAQRR